MSFKKRVLLWVAKCIAMCILDLFGGNTLSVEARFYVDSEVHSRAGQHCHALAR